MITKLVALKSRYCITLRISDFQPFPSIYCEQVFLLLPSSLRRQRGQVVRAPDCISEAPSSLAGFVHGSFEFRSSAVLVNSQLVCLRLV